MADAAQDAAIAAINATVVALVKEAGGTYSDPTLTLNNDLTTLWLLLGAYIVFFMQAGFALLEAGSVRAKNTKNILLKNTLDACLGGLIWWSIGYPFAYGEDGMAPNAFIGGKDFFMYEKDTVQSDGGFYAGWLFQWAFAAAAATIVSGAVAERCQFSAYLTYTAVITGFIYPVVVHWGWSGEGWLSAFRTTDYEYDPMIEDSQGLIDFAGSGIVHMTGGGSALMGAIFLGPRMGRFRENGEVVDMPGHSTVLAALGTFILWFGWYGFNPVSTLCMVGCMNIAAKVAVTTTLAAAAGGTTVLAITVAMTKVPDVGPALNGILAGLVSITAPCSVVEPWAAAFIGMIGGFVYVGSSKMLLKLKIDDPLDASPVHFFCGAWGVLSVGLFATEYNTMTAYGNDPDAYGVFYGGDAMQLAVQILGVVVITLWVCGTSGIMFMIMSQAKILRVSEEDERAGLDTSHHGGAAYDLGAK